MNAEIVIRLEDSFRSEEMLNEVSITLDQKLVGVRKMEEVKSEAADFLEQIRALKKQGVSGIAG